jgi:hypothetical protein
MTAPEQTAPDANAEVTPDATPEVTPEPVVLDEFGTQFKARIAQSVTELIAVNEQIAKYQGSRDDIIDALEQSHEGDEAYQKLDATITKLDQELSKLVAQKRSILEPVADSILANAAEAVKPLLETQSTLKKTVDSGVKYMIGEYGEGAVTDLALPKAVRKSAAGSGDGGNRIRNLDVYVNGQLATQANKDGEKKSNLAAAAKAAQVETSVMQEAFWTAQGTKDAKAFKPEVEFEVTATIDGKEVTRKILAKKRA